MLNKILLIYLIVINLAAFVLYGVDKRKAIKHRSRVPERRLILLAVLGGSPAALLAMYLFHHKTKKNKFRLGIPFILLAQLTFIILLEHYFIT